MSVVSIIIAILIFAFLIFFHEMGHMLVAKACGIRVNEFQIGFGPRLFGFTKGETKYSVKLIPFGGACLMEGEDAESEDTRAFCNKPLWQRFLVVFAGPGFNFILAWILALIVLFSMGVDKPIITSVSEGLPAEEAGLLPGDRITYLNSYKVDFFRDISVYSFFNGENPIEVSYERDGVSDKVSITPALNEETGRYILGVYGHRGREKVGFFETLGYGFAEIKYQIYNTVQSLRMLVTGRISPNELSGPVGIVRAMGDTFTQSMVSGAFIAVMNMINFSVLLSANLGVMNLLPIPALDGGRILLFIVEAIRRKKLSEKVEGIIHGVGFGLLMLIMVFVFFNDIRKFFI